MPLMRWMFAAVLALSALAGPAHAEKYSLHGEVRARYETLGAQFRAGLDGGDQLLAFRTNVLGQARFDNVTLAAELVDSRAYLADEGSSLGTSEVNALELVQAHARFAFADASLQLGRFTMELGSRRLLERGNFPNVVNGFTGARVDWAAAEHVRTTFFYTLPHVRLPNDKPSLLDNEVAFDQETDDFRFWGAFLTVADLPFDATGEAYLLGLDDDRPANNGVSRDRHLLTPGVRVVRRTPGRALDVELEAGLQRGELGALDVEAAFAHATLGYTFARHAWSPRLAFDFDYASGDASPADGETNRFDALFGSRSGDFGPTGIFGPVARANLIAPGLRAAAAPTERLSLDANYRALWLDEPTDAFGNTGVRDASGLSGDFAGHLIKAGAAYSLSDSMEFEAGVAALFKGEFLERAPNANGEGDTAYGFAALTFTF